MNIVIRKARSTENEILTKLAIASNRYWHYPEDYHAIWDRELQMDPSHIERNIVYVAECDDLIIGYFSIVHIRINCSLGCRFVNKGYWLENLFIRPEHIGKGIGSSLVAFARSLCREMEVRELYVFVEPFSKGFYDKMGGKFIRETPTSLAGGLYRYMFYP